MENYELQGEELSKKGEQYYEKHLKAKLEKDHFGEIIAIEPISGEYFFGERDIDAVMEGRKKFSKRLFYIKRIGHQAVHHVYRVK